MGYQVLSRKWRPQRFEDVVGQKHVTSTLQNAIEQDRIAHAYLFTGPRGIGKTTTARILAKYLNCQNPQDLNPCNECKNCEEITAGRSFDVLEIDGASNRGIDNIRELREVVKYPPSDGNYRIYIVDEVHMLTKEAFNALLKTLEEPPSHVIFIFATTEPEAVLPTIVSRTQRFDFKRIPLQKIIGLLRTICEAEGIQISDGALTLIARKADGSMRDAESLLDQVISFAGSDIPDESVATILGIVDYDLYIRLHSVLHERDPSGAFGILNEVLRAGYDLSEFLAGLADFWRNLLVLNATGQPDLLEIPETYHERFQSVAGEYEERDLLRLLNLTLSAQHQFRDVRNQRVFLENFLLKLVHFDSSVRIEELLSGGGASGVEGMSGTSSGTASATPKRGRQSRGGTGRNIGQKKTRVTGERHQTTPEPEADQPEENSGSANDTSNAGDPSGGNSLSLEEFQTSWEEFSEHVKREKTMLGQFLTECEPVNVSGKVLEVLFDRTLKFHMNWVRERSDEVETLIDDYFGRTVRLKCKAGETGRTDKRTREEDAEQDPITRAIIDHFDGEIIR